MTADALHDAILDRIEHRVADNYREVDGGQLRVNPHAVAVIAAPAALAAIDERGLVIVRAEDVRGVLGPKRGVSAYIKAGRRLLDAVEDPAQPSGTLHSASEGKGGISGRLDLSEASTGLSGLRDAIALSIRQRVRISPVGRAGVLLAAGEPIRMSGAEAEDAADAALAVRDEELKRVSGYAKRMEEMVIERDHEATQWAGWLHAAEVVTARAKALHSRDDSNPHGPWCGTCTTPWPCRTWIALDTPEET